jgi:hypothetical protein
MDKTKNKPRGRPRIARSARKRNFVTMRMRDALKAQLEEAAEINQRSLSEEIENQLEELFLFRRMLPNFGRAGLFEQMAMLGDAMQWFEEQTGKAWDEDEKTVEEVLRRATANVINLKRFKLELRKAAEANQRSVGEEVLFRVRQRKDKDKEKQS